MARIFLVLVLIVACVAGLGFYLGWFDVTVHKDKIQADEQKVLDKVHGIGSRGTDKATTPAETSGERAVPPVQPSANPN